jgi:hypothetical protein
MEGKRQRDETEGRYIGGEKEGKRQRGTEIGKEKEENMQERREKEG